jgi:Zn ribbon nucleic-acid-binding protein
MSSDAASLESAAICNPACPKCGEQMRLAMIEPTIQGQDRRTFNCASCGHTEQVMVQLGR